MRRLIAGLVISGPAALGGQARDGEPYTVLHAIAGTDGQYPEGGVAVARDGTIYGTTSFGQKPTIFGTVFKSDPSGRFVTLHVFNGMDGSGPEFSSPTLLSDKLYGSTTGGGPIAPNYGVLYSVGAHGPGSPRRQAAPRDDGVFGAGRLRVELIA